MSAYAALNRRAWEQNLLFSALVELTYRCNLDCFYCYNDLGLRGRPLAYDQYLRLFDDLQDLGTLNLTFSGGEPLAHRDFFRLGGAARERGFVVRIKSNGHALSGTRARRIKQEIDPFVIEISLHGATAATHDRQTRVPGSFERLMTNLRELRALGLRVKLNATLTAWNENELEAMHELADDMGLRLDFSMEVTPRDDGDREPLSIAPSTDAMRRLVRFRQQRALARADADADAERETRNPVARQGKHCGSASAGVAVDPYGNVYPCVQWRRPAGNLHRQSIAEIWSGSPVLEQVRRLTGGAVKEFVDGHGPAGVAMGFCPALAEQMTGSPVRLSADMQRRLSVLREVERE